MKEENKYKSITKEEIEKFLLDICYNPPKRNKKEEYINSFYKEKVSAPKGWEDNLREKLMKELPNGLYPFGNEFGEGKIMGYGGKGFKIELEVALQKELRGYL